MENLKVVIDINYERVREFFNNKDFFLCYKCIKF